MNAPRRLVVVGGGIAGLAAAWQASARPGVQVVVLEADDRFGGRIRTSDLDLGDGTTIRVDEGADAFLARVPDAVALCHELGLDDELTQPATGRASVWAGDRLRPLPSESVLGVPLDPDELETIGILSAAGLAAVRAERDAPSAAPDHDVAIGAFLGERFGDELVDRVVGPLIGGINAGDVHELSLRAVTPQLADAAADGGVLSDALARRRGMAPAGGPVFHTLRGGMQRLVDALVDALRARGVELRTSSSVRALGVRSDGTVSLTLAGDPNGAGPNGGSPNGGRSSGGSGTSHGTQLEADAAVVCTPAPAAARLLADVSPGAAAELADISHSSPVLACLVYDRAQLDVDPAASGFLVPRDAGLFVTAVSFGSSKWAHWDDGRHVILRASAGHAHDDRPATMSDVEIVAAITADLQVVLGLDATPLSARVTRYPDGFAQYRVGHLERVARIESALAQDAPTVRVAGSAYRGVGIPASIRSGRLAAEQLLSDLDDEQSG